jgi:hypothetical protein
MFSAKRAVQGLFSIGMTERSVVFLSGGWREDSAVRALAKKELDMAPTTDAENVGMGKAMGALLGGTVGQVRYCGGCWERPEREDSSLSA